MYTGEITQTSAHGLETLAIAAIRNYDVTFSSSLMPATNINILYRTAGIMLHAGRQAVVSSA
jgi:hypothetical protein